MKFINFSKDKVLINIEHITGICEDNKTVHISVKYRDIGYRLYNYSYKQVILNLAKAVEELEDIK